MKIEPEKISDIKGARILAILGDSITTDHISPAGSIKADSPAGKYLIAKGVTVKDFNSYGVKKSLRSAARRFTSVSLTTFLPLTVTLFHTKN